MQFECNHNSSCRLIIKFNYKQSYNLKILIDSMLFFPLMTMPFYADLRETNTIQVSATIYTNLMINDESNWLSSNLIVGAGACLLNKCKSVYLKKKPFSQFFEHSFCKATTPLCKISMMVSFFKHVLLQNYLNIGTKEFLQKEWYFCEYELKRYSHLNPQLRHTLCFLTTTLMSIKHMNLYM